jgi:hypothetical protein
VDHDAVAEEVIRRAVARGELPAGAALAMAGLIHEVIEAQVLRQMMNAAALDGAFARHVIDDIVLPLVAGHMAGGPAAK